MKIQSFPTSVKVQTTKTVSAGRVLYNSTTLLVANGETINNTTKTYSGLATDGTHIWLRMNNCTKVTYNGETLAFARNGNYFQIEMPQDFDPTVPLVFR